MDPIISEHRIKKAVVRNVFTIAFVVILIIGCNKSQETIIPTQVITETTSTLKQSQTNIGPSQTPVMTVPTETTIATFDWSLSNIEIDIPQGAVYFTTHEPSNNQFLYKYVNVTIITEPEYGQVFLNLDNLKDNGFSNSDIILFHETDKLGTWFNLFTSNGSRYYYSDLNNMSYDSCMEHFPFTKMDPDYYMTQSIWFGRGRDYCILTNEGRLSILRFDQATEYSEYFKNPIISFVVTTYQQIVPQVLTPQPTNTPGPSPTPGRYSGMNLTMKQETNLDMAAQTFLDAVTAYDKEKVADLIEYPLAIAYDDYKYVDEIKNREEFIAAFDGIFNPDFVRDLKSASLEENMGIHYRNELSLLVKNGWIVFYPNGKIHYISPSSIWWEVEYELSDL